MGERILKPDIASLQAGIHKIRMPFILERVIAKIPHGCTTITLKIPHGCGRHGMSKKVKLRGKVRYNNKLVEASQERRNHMEQIAVQEIAMQKKENTDMSAAESNQPPCGNVLRRHEKANPMTLKLAQHRVWMESVPHEYPMPYNHYRIGVYIRYYNQTKHKNYLEKHMQQFMDDISLCPNWTLVDFYVDHGMSAPRMENAKEWCRLLQDCVEEKVDLIVTQKVSNVSNDPQEMTLVARMLASLRKPVGIYFISEDIYTGASYYMPEYREQGWLPPGWKVLPPDELDEAMRLENVQPAHEISAAEAVEEQKTGQR